MGRIMRLLRTDITERGTIYASSKGPVLYTKGFKWIDSEGREHITEQYEISFPKEGTLRYVGIGPVFDLLWSRFSEEATIELSDDFKRRLKHQISTGTYLSDNPEAHPDAGQFSPQWTDYQFSNPDRYEISESLEKDLDNLFAVKGYRRGTTKASQKLAQAKYRQKEDSKVSAKRRRRVSLDNNIVMRNAQKWIKANPGKTFEDYMKLEESNAN